MKKIILIGMLVGSIVLTGCQGQNTTTNGQDVSTSSPEASTNESPVFPQFTTKDLDGNVVDSSIFSGNDLTMVNFWFTGCSACISEMPMLQELSEDLKGKSVGMVGICTDADYSPDLLEDAQNLVKENNLTYPNLLVSDDQAFRSYIDEIFAYPTTIFVDKEGNIVGEPLIGAIQNQSQVDDIHKTIDNLLNS